MKLSRPISLIIFSLLLAALVSGCAEPAPDSLPPVIKMESWRDIDFKDSVRSNADVPHNLSELKFVDTDGNQVALANYVGKQNVVLVFTEGYADALCPFCQTQTSRLITNYARFQELNTEIIVVYPGDIEHLDEFIREAKTTAKDQVEKVPFPIVLDPALKAVDFFNIRSMLAHPSTYVIGRGGEVLLAYVGEDMSADRPSVKALLEILQGADRGSEQPSPADATEEAP